MLVHMLATLRFALAHMTDTFFVLVNCIQCKVCVFGKIKLLGLSAFPPCGLFWHYFNTFMAVSYSRAEISGLTVPKQDWKTYQYPPQLWKLEQKNELNTWRSATIYVNMLYFCIGKSAYTCTYAETYRVGAIMWRAREWFNLVESNLLRKGIWFN